MKLVIDLMRKIFLIMFFCLLFLEIIVLISLSVLYRIPLERNKPLVEFASLENTKQLISSFNNKLERAYYNVETDLLLTAKHMYPMYLSNTNTTNISYPKFKKGTRFYNSFTKCIIEATSTSRDINLKKLLIEKYKDFNFPEDQIIDSLMKEPNLDQILIFPPGRFRTLTDQQKAYLEVYSCFSKSIFKTLLIRDFVFKKFYKYLDYFLFIDRRFVFRYPTERLDFTTISKMNYYTPKCKILDNLDSCFTTFDNPIEPDKIIFDKPISMIDKVISRGCINVQYSPDSTHNYACIDFNLSEMIPTIIDETIKLFVINYDKIEDDVLIYVSKLSDHFNYTKFESNKLGKYQLNETSTSIKLFHVLYYDIISNIDFEVLNLEALMPEYRQTVSALKRVYEDFEGTKTKCDSNDIYQQNITLKQTIRKKNVDIVNGAGLTYDQENFQYAMKAVKLNYTKFDQNSFVFNSKCSADVVLYTLGIVQVGTISSSDEIYITLVLKCIRSFFFFVFLLLFANIVYFIVCEIYIKFLVYPVKHIQKNLENLIKEKIIPDSEYLEKEKDSNYSNYVPELKEGESGQDFYRNVETKKLSDLLNFLKKIVIMKQAHGHTDYKVKSIIYSKFLNETFEKSQYRQCLFIIAYSKYKGKCYKEAYADLEALKKLTEAEEAEVLKKNDALEQNIINIPSLFANDSKSGMYINEFSYNEANLDPDLNKLIKLRIFHQNVSYLHGLVKYLDFQSRKQEAKEKHTFDKIARMTKRGEDKQLLEDAIGFLKNSLSINTNMNINRIKSVFIIILIAKCNFYLEKYAESSIDLEDALKKFAELNKDFLDEEKFAEEQIDPRVMFLINNIIMENLMFCLGRVCEKLKKKHLAGWIFNKTMEITYFRTNDFFRKACKKLDKFFDFEKDSVEFNKCKSLLGKISRRLEIGSTKNNKQICIIVSENLLKNFQSHFELKEVLLKCINKYTLELDLISYFQFDNGIQCLIPQGVKSDNIKLFRESEEFCKYSGNIDKEQNARRNSMIKENKTDFFKAVNTAIDLLDNDTNFYDKYIFAFLLAEDFRFSSVNENTDLQKRLIDNNISFYNFFFDEFVPEMKIMKIKKYLKELVEGFLFFVKNFKIINQAFQNISNKGKQKNILNASYDNHKYIL